MKYPIIILLLIIGLPIFAMGQIKTNVEKPKVSEKGLKTMDMPKRKPADMPKRKVEDPPKRKANSDVSAIQADSTMKVVLGETMTEIIGKATLITAYEVESFVSENQEDETLEGFKILQSALLEQDQSTWIKQMLLSEETYFFSEKQKQCLFLPKLGLQFVHHQDTTNILISFKCDFTRFHEAAPFTLDSDDGHENLWAFYREVFPMDVPSVYASQEIGMVQNVKSDEKVQPAPTFGSKLQGNDGSKVNAKSKPEVPLHPIFYTIEKGDAWVIVAQKATNTLREKVSVKDLCEWNNIDFNAVESRKRFLKSGETIIVGFKK